MARTHLGEFEQMVLLAILQLEQDAFGTSIAEELETRAGREVSRGALYSSLDRLEKKGYLRWETGAATSERGGQPRRRFEVTPEGAEVLRQAHAAWKAMTRGLNDFLRKA